MQRKPSFPVANCNIKMPDPANMSEPHLDEDYELKRRQKLINFGHSQWGFNNWSWTVTKQDVDFVDFNNGKYCAGVASFVLITVKTLDVRRENVGYATSSAHTKGLAIHNSRKAAVTNALRETLLSFGGTVAVELLEASEAVREATPEPKATPTPAPAPAEPKNSPVNRAPRPKEQVCANEGAANPVRAPKPAAPPLAAVAPRAPRAAPPQPPQPRPNPNPNVSFVLQPVMPPLYPPQRLPPQQLYPNYYEYAGPWHFAYEYERPMPPGNVNLNFNMPPKSLVVNGRGGECKAACRPAEGEPLQYAGAQPHQGCWIKPTIFYDGFWTEQKVKKWVAEQVEKQFPEDGAHKPPSPGGPDPNSPK